MFTLSLLRVPIGVAMGIVGVSGFAATTSFGAAISLLGTSPFSTASDPGLVVIPLFILMGALASSSGLSAEIFRAAYSWLGHRRGGLAYATLAACGGFAAINGSSVATAVTMTKIALPQMRGYGYDASIGAGVLAAGGTLGIMIPPSVVFVIYGLMTDQDIGKLFIAGILPGLLAIALYATTIAWLAWKHPERLPAASPCAWFERWDSLRGLWATILLFTFVLGGMYWGFFTPTEAAAMGVVGALCIGVVRRKLLGVQIIAALTDAVKVTASIFTIVIGAYLFGYLLTTLGTTQAIVEYLTSLPVSRYVVLSLILAMYVILGAVMDELAMILLTVPIVYPAMMQLGFDPIWFGVVIAMTVTFGMICPPVGMNVFVVHASAPDIPIRSIYAGVMPFIAADVVRLALLILFPAISLWLPSLMS
ncbi:TRAP transporter large permease [Hydrogenophaga sp.]|uniref:TRAP transporter large permease n=1 Tax=Hydrogenophaga sp. TaxID=1904254 RepID=UPI002AB8C74F|nr:TRAP transporter large permease [Hydrogenophaga sp.]MDZ4397525.1 TRAP transporter large permease [Hydrogenophaga sp.]